MMTTQTLPTDKNGNVYRGPRTYEQACNVIDQGASATKVVEILRDAGFTGVANRVAKDYAGQINA